MPSFLRLDFRLSKKPLRRRESTSTHVKFDGWRAVSNVEYKGSVELNLAKILNKLLIWKNSKQKQKNKQKKNKQMLQICTIFLSNIFLGIWYGDLGYSPPPLPTPTPMKGPAIPHWGVILSASGNYVFSFLRNLDSDGHLLIAFNCNGKSFFVSRKYRKCASGLDWVNSKLIIKYKFRLFYL